MSSDPGRNDGESNGATQAQELVCKGPSCGKAFVRKKATGRPPKFCSRACKSRNDRARAAERQVLPVAPDEQQPQSAPAQVLPGLATPALPIVRDLAEAPGELSVLEQLTVRAAVGQGPLSATMAPGNARRLVQGTEAVQRRALAYLQELESGDPVAAFEEFAEQLITYGTLLRSTGLELRDAARWPDLTYAQRHDARMREDWDLPEDWRESEKAEAAFEAGLEASRGETRALPAADEPPVSPRATDRVETTDQAPAGSPGISPRPADRAETPPAGPPPVSPRTGGRGETAGQAHGQALAVPAAREAGTQGAPPAVVEPDWFDPREAAQARAAQRTAVLDRPENETARRGQPALQSPLGWDLEAPPEPFARGFGDCDVVGPLDQLGPNWLLAGWSTVPSVFYVVYDNEIEGWVERGLGGGSRWVAIRGGAFLGDATTQQPLLHPTPELAARTVAQAREMGL